MLRQLKWYNNDKSNFLRDLPYEKLQELSENDIQQILKAENLYWKNKPFTKYYIVVNGAKTKMVDSFGHRDILQNLKVFP